MTQPDNTYDPLAWGSHLPVLLAAVGSSEGIVLEVGVGHFSTPALHAICGSTERKLISVEDNEIWCEEFRNRYENDGHVFLSGNYDSSIPEAIRGTCKNPGDKFGVSFIDNSPGGERRRKDFQALILNSEYVVVHDYELDNERSIVPVLLSNNAIQWYVYREYKPATLLASIFRELPLKCL